jgi:hypothetical protein
MAVQFMQDAALSSSSQCYHSKNQLINSEKKIHLDPHTCGSAVQAAQSFFSLLLFPSTKPPLKPLSVTTQPPE